MVIKMMKRPRNWSYREELNNRTASAMIANGSSWDDIPAIRMFSNDIMDEMQKAGMVTTAESDRLSQKVTIKEVQKLMKNMKRNNYRADKYLVAGMQQAPTYKTVNYNEITPLDDGHAKYRGRIFATKEDLKYMPKRVRLVDIGR